MYEITIVKQLLYNNDVASLVRVTSLSLHSAILIVIPGHHPPTCFSTPIHLCLHYHWHPHDLSMT